MKLALTNGTNLLKLNVMFFNNEKNQQISTHTSAAIALI